MLTHPTLDKLHRLRLPEKYIWRLAVCVAWLIIPTISSRYQRFVVRGARTRPRNLRGIACTERVPSSIS